jgi:sec-independent protein translocase protein TatB
MFDMGFTEMMLIGIVALVVIGPERLPGVARTAGKYFTRLRNFMMDVRADVESELKADELREMLKKQQEELRSLKDVVSDVGKDLNLSEDIGVAEIKKSIEDAMPDLNTRLDSDPVPETKAEPKKSVTVSSKKKVTSKKASPKPKAAPKTKATPKKSKAASKLSPKAKAAPKKAKATPNRVKAVPETKVATKTRAKPKTIAKLKPETESGWASSIVLPGSPTDAD